MKRPWNIEINPEPVYGPERVVKKSRAMGLSEINSPVSPWQAPHDVQKRIIDILSTEEGRFTCQTSQEN